MKKYTGIFEFLNSKQGNTESLVKCLLQDAAYGYFDFKKFRGAVERKMDEADRVLENLAKMDFECAELQNFADDLDILAETLSHLFAEGIAYEQTYLVFAITKGCRTPEEVADFCNLGRDYIVDDIKDVINSLIREKFLNADWSINNSNKKSLWTRRFLSDFLLNFGDCIKDARTQSRGDICEIIKNNHGIEI